MKNKIVIRSVNLDNVSLSSLIFGIIGSPSKNKAQKIIESYKQPNHTIMGAFVNDNLIGILGIHKTKELTIRHMGVLKESQRQGIGTLLLNNIKNHYKECKIIVETDVESVDFYIKLNFVCHAFKGKHGNLRYTCTFL